MKTPSDGWKLTLTIDRPQLAPVQDPKAGSRSAQQLRKRIAAVRTNGAARKRCPFALRSFATLS